ncbi:MAG TPA: hypothetical protein VEG30_06695 [Terriglobales bacterium]|nr:hypothetical protein [Terriglobales bacterium]
MPHADDALLDRHERALALRTVGGLLLVVDFVLIVFIPSDWQVGSTMWLWWTGIQAVLGAVLVGVGHIQEQKIKS